MSVQLLAPDDAVIQAEPWFKGHEGKPTQAERIRAVLQARGDGHGSATNASELVETKTAALGRDLYTRASGALHSGTERDEVTKVELYVRAVLMEILPPLQ